MIAEYDITPQDAATLTATREFADRFEPPPRREEPEPRRQLIRANSPAA